MLLGPDRRVEVRGRLCNLAEDFDDVDLADFDGLTAAALLDLVSAAWLQALVDRWSVTHRPLLFAVDGGRPHLVVAAAAGRPGGHRRVSA